MKTLLFLLFVVVMMVGLSLATYFVLESQIDKSAKREAYEYAEIANFRKSLESYTAARKDVGAFREFDEAFAPFIMRLISNQQELDARLKKVEKGCRK